MKTQAPRFVARLTSHCADWFLPVLAAAALFCARQAQALGPHEVVALVNRNSPRSIAVAAEFARVRRVPDCNVIKLDIPSEKGDTPLSISADDFTEYIWTPANKAIRKQGIGDHILAWIYSVDFPVRISTDPPISIQGLTLTRNKAIDPDLVKKGTWPSPLFTSPAHPMGRPYPSQSFDVSRGWLGDGMPLPSMML